VSVAAAIEFEQASVTVDTPDGPLTLLHPITTTFTEQRIGLIGSNGSGKSTLARMINGLVEPTIGTVKVHGHDTVAAGREVRRRVGFMFTNPDAQLVMPTCVEDIALSLRRTIKNKHERLARAHEILAEFGLASKANTSVHALSGGQKQMLALAGVLATEPSIVVADEPTTLLDLRNTTLVADRLFALPQQLVIVTHDLGIAARCERIVVVDDARVAFDGPAADAIEFYRDLVTAP
jgi:biotin transport system ATP-binding protein